MSLCDTPLPNRRVRLLGGFSVEVAGRHIAIPHAGARTLLAYLALHPDVPQHREPLVERLWPDLMPQAGRRTLSDAIYRLGRAVGPGWLQVTRRSVALADPEAIWVDAGAFQRLADSADPHTLQAALDLYCGDLLPEIYADWATAPRVALREHYLATIERLALDAEAAGRVELAAERFRRLIAADPLHEAGHCGVMRALARAGRLHEALDHYHRLEALLRAEIGAEPLAETRLLAAQLRAEEEVTRRSAQEPLFIGRVAERAILLDQLDRAGARRGGIAVILGEAGIGKSRLLEEIARSARWRRWQVALGRGEALALPPTYAPLDQALAAALPPPRLQQLAQLLPPFWLACLSQLAPVAAAVAPRITIAPADPDRLAVALRHALAALRRITPLMILLDDVQWAGPGLWPLLDRLRPALADLGVLLIVSGRDDQLRAQPSAWERLTSWERAGAPLIHLAGLTADELADLGRARLRTALSAEQRHRLWGASGGNPLIALTILYGGPPDQPAAHQSLDTLLAHRLAALAPIARQALDAAAVIGYHFDYALWRQTCAEIGLPTADLPEQAGALERAELIALDPAGYRFTHDTLRAYVYTQAGPARRRLLHTAALAALQTYTPQAARDLLYHAERSERIDQVGPFALQVGAELLQSGAPQEAARYFEQALAALPPDARNGHYTALRGLAQALDRLGERERQSEAVARLYQLAEDLGQAALRAEAAWQRANLDWATGQFSAAHAQARSGIDLARASGDRRQEALLLELAGRAARDLGDYPAAYAHFSDARQCYLDLDDQLGAAWIDGMLGLVAQRQGRLAEAVAYQRHALAAHQAAGDPYSEMRAATGLAIALWMCGDYLEAQAIFERTLQISRQVDDRRIEEASLANLGALADILGDYESAIELKAQALALSRSAENLMGVAVGLCNLGITAYKLGRLDASLTAFDEALMIDRATGRRHGEAHCLHGRGITLAAMGRRAEARAAVEAARSLRLELDERDGLVASAADLALIDLEGGDLSGARQSLDQARGALRPEDRPDLHELVAYAAFRVFTALGDERAAYAQLERAVAAMDTSAGALPTDLQERLLRRDPLNRRVSAAAAGLARTVEVRLAHAAAPLGRSLAGDEYVVVRWTLEAPGDGLLAAPDRRRRVLRRLLAEAAAHGAAPTDDDLAAALGVSRRTILRDIAGLADAGQPPRTRRRKRPAE